MEIDTPIVCSAPTIERFRKNLKENWFAVPIIYNLYYFYDGIRGYLYI